jgi:hypothetical protein
LLNTTPVLGAVRDKSECNNVKKVQQAVSDVKCLFNGQLWHFSSFV